MVAGVSLPNPASVSLHERFAFRPVAPSTQSAGSLTSSGTSPGLSVQFGSKAVRRHDALRTG